MRLPGCVSAAAPVYTQQLRGLIGCRPSGVSLSNSQRLADIRWLAGPMGDTLIGFSQVSRNPVAGRQRGQVARIRRNPSSSSSSCQRKWDFHYDEKLFLSLRKYPPEPLSSSEECRPILSSRRNFGRLIVVVHIHFGERINQKQLKLLRRGSKAPAN